MKKEDWVTLQKLQEQFATELATLRGRVDNLEARAAKPERQQFSTTAKRQADVTFLLQDTLIGDNARSGDQRRFVTHYTSLSEIIVRQSSYIAVCWSVYRSMQYSNPNLIYSFRRVGYVCTLWNLDSCVWQLRGMHHPDEPRNASYDRAKALIRLAEEGGFTTTLIAQHLINPRNAEFDQLETWTTAAALAEATDDIEIIAAIKPLLVHPAVLAKMALGIDAISRGRFAINLVSAWFKPEMEKSGIPFPPHDDRYRYSKEWIQIVKALWSGNRIDFQGNYFQIDNLQLLPRSIAQPRPRVYLGGESDAARALAAQEADVFFLNGQPIDVIRQTIAEVRALPRTQAPLQFAMSAFVIARSTDAEAKAEFERLRALVALDDRSELLRGVDADVVMFKNMAKYPSIGSNGGTAAGLVGSYDTVARRIAEFIEAGVETFMLQFQPFTTEMHRFSAEVMPRVRSLALVA